MADMTEVAATWHPPELNPDLPLGAYKDEDDNLVVWVNASPGNPRESSGWFEKYKGDPSDYSPNRGAEEGEDGYLDNETAKKNLAGHAAENKKNIERVNSELDEEIDRAKQTLSGEALDQRLNEIEQARP